MKRITKYLLPVIILIAIVLALAVLGFAGNLLATIGRAVVGFFVKHWDYAIIVVVTSIVTSLICAWLEEHGNFKGRATRQRGIISDDDDE